MLDDNIDERRALVTPRVPEEDAERVGEIFDALREQLGWVPDGVRLYALSPPLLEAFVANVAYFRNGTHLSATLTTMIRYLVSSQSECRFCIDLNEGFLAHMGVDLEAARAARDDPRAAPIEERERSLLAVALKAVNTPDAVTRDDLQSARDQGWSDREIFDSVVQAANNRAFNLVLKTFNVERQGVFA